VTWNYRIVRYLDNKGFGLHEVYYNEAGKPYAMTEDPCRFSCDVEEGAEGVRGSLLTAFTDANRRPVFDEPKKWAKR
jgi:hypothetical protein